MATDGKKFDIELGTRADTSGLEATERGLRAVEQAGTDAVGATNPMTDGSQLAAGASEAAAEVDALAESFRDAEEAVGDLEQSVDALREAQQQADVQAAERMRSERDLTEQLQESEAAMASQIARAAALGGVALIAKAAWGSLSAAVQEYRRLAPEAADEFREPFDTIELALQTIQSPVETLIEGLTGTQTALENLAASQQEAARQEAQYLEALRIRQQELAAASTQRINNYLAAELRGIQEQTEAYESQLRVINAVASAEAARLGAREAVAGADPAAARGRGTDAAMVLQDQRVATAEQAVEAAIRTFEAAGSALARANADPNATREQINELSTATQAAQDAVGAAQERLAEIAAVAEAAKVEILAGAVVGFQSVVDADAEANTRAAQEAKAKLEAQAQQQGDDFVAGGREALNILTGVLADGVVKPEELSAVTQAIQQAQNASTRLNADVLAGFETLERTNEATISGLAEVTARLRQIEAQAEAMRAQIAAGN